MNRLLGLTVGKNETMRYLMPMLAHSAYVFDEHFFYDDGSTDGTPEVASGLGCTVRHRPSNGCAFTEDEGTFRGEAWRSFEDAVGPEVGDWVFVLDCDEFIVTTKSARPTDVRRQIIDEAWNLPLLINFAEIFGFAEDGWPLERVDRAWGSISGLRLFPYHPGGTYSSGKYGVPPVPTYVTARPYSTSNELLVLHYGYARSEDQSARYERYAGRPGHSRQHVQSIVEPGRLQRLDSPWVVPVIETAGA